MRRSVIIAVLLFLLDAFILNQGLIAIITLVIALPIIAIRALLHKKDTTLLKKRLTACGIYLIMAVFILISNTINNRIAKYRANILIDVCEKYKSENGTYPQKLSELVPKYINKIPVAKYTLLSSKYSYIASEESHLLFYVAIPPFGRPTYSFEKKKWTYID